MTFREFLGGRVALYPGDCIDVLKTLPEASVDSVVCDPPYGLEFMGKDWDKLGDKSHRHSSVERSGFGLPRYGSWFPSATEGGIAKLAQHRHAMQKWHYEWACEVYRVLKPGAHLVAFSGTRTYHRMVCAIEDAGFEIRDQLAWAYGSGFPKSHDVSKGIDRAAGKEPEVISEWRTGFAGTLGGKAALGGLNGAEDVRRVTAPATEAAKQWEGWGTALKPAFEPIICCSKPLTVYQFIAISLEAMTREIAECLSLSASDAERLFTDTLAKSRRVQADTVLAHARTRVLESIATASFAAQLSTCRSLEPSDHGATPAGFAPNAAKANGSRSTASAKRTLSGRVAASLSALTDITTSVLLGGTSASIVTSWSKFSDDALSDQSTYTIETATRLIIGLRTLRSSLHQITSDGTGNFSPNWSSIVLARKPLIGTIAENVLRHGTGALNIDGCRIETDDDNLNGGTYSGELRDPGPQICLENRNRKRGIGEFVQPVGRWPANLVHDGSPEVMEAFPETKPSRDGEIVCAPNGSIGTFVTSERVTKRAGADDGGSAARFFYTAKADAEDRLGSKHPTVKPLDLIQWLCRLVTPRGGIVLDCFAGTGTTGEAAWREGMRAILVEREPEYIADIERRMELAANPTKRAAVAKTKNNLEKPEDLPLFLWPDRCGVTP